MEIQNAQNISKYNGFRTKGGNYVWGAALGLAWNQIIQKFTQQHIKVGTKDQHVLQLVDNFNKSLFSKKDIDQKCIYVKSGYGQQTVTAINVQSKKKFPQKSFKDLDIKMGERDIIAYAYLLKKLQFKVKFQLKKEGSFKFCGQNVPSFYALQKKQKSQVRHFYYKNSDQFMIKIDSKNENDLIYFIKDNDLKTVDQAIKRVIQYENNKSSQLDKIDYFEMPLVELDVSRNVTELIGKNIKNKKLQDYVFSVVYQAVKLKIDEAGAKVQNQAVITMKCKMAIQKKQPKIFYLDKQFWIVMKQQQKHPYFAALIKNPLDK